MEGSRVPKKRTRKSSGKICEKYLEKKIFWEKKERVRGRERERERERQGEQRGREVLGIDRCHEVNPEREQRLSVVNVKHVGRAHRVVLRLSRQSGASG
jgi:hypothetical protein